MRLSKKSFCQTWTICWRPSFMMAILMGSWCSLTVPRSLRVMLNDESPSMSSTVRSGQAICAPMAAGRPKPMVPSEPEETIDLGVVQRRNWQAIIWWLPTPVETQSLSRVSWKPVLSASITDCVLSWPSGAGVYEKGKSFLSCVQRALHSGRAWRSTMGSSMRSDSLQSPATATVGLTTRPNCEVSMSKWTSPPRPSSCASRASGAYLLSTPVVRSSKREPMATIRSDSWMA
mmetsp:Transcript_14509/g.31428  ORF Transcript_14509/g.31428 Transcript_14509/m.31428 type:complete len:232 (-) Transcript_14509:996-1691(-)